MSGPLIEVSSPSSQGLQHIEVLSLPRARLVQVEGNRVTLPGVIGGHYWPGGCLVTKAHNIPMYHIMFFSAMISSVQNSSCGGQAAVSDVYKLALQKQMMSA